MLKTQDDSSRTRGFLSQLLAMLLVLQPLLAPMALAAPEGADVVQGNVTFETAGSVTTIHASDRSIINYSGFDIAGHETVRFIQPGELAAVLNRIQSAAPTHVNGSLLANGQVYIVNPAGVYFGQNAYIDVAGLVAAAGSISNQDFLNGVDRFTDLQGSVENLGTIEAGMVAMIGRHVANHGVITADQGLITMVAGDSVFIGKRGDRGFVKIDIESLGGAGAFGVENSGRLEAEGGNVVLAAGDFYSLAVRHTGVTRARSIVVEGGNGGIVEVSGTLDASNDAGVGGSVQVLGDRVAVLDAEIDASGASGGGSVLIGGDRHGQGELRTANRTYVSADAVVRADATENGDGGEVVVWADEVAQVEGSISARGGAQGGDGGWVETSGLKLLIVTEAPDVSAPAGSGGTWLLDPEDIEITDADANITTTGGGDPGPIVFSPTFDDTPTTVSAALISGALGTGANVEITTASGGTTTTGTITVSSAITKIADGGSADGSSLTLDADNDIIVNAPISSTVGSLDVDLQATNDVEVNAAITTNGGSFASSGAGSFDNTGLTPTVALPLVGPGTITTAGGGVTISHGGAVTIGAPISAGAGTVAINATGSGDVILANNAISTTGSAAIRAAGGDIDSQNNDGTVEVTANDLLLDAAGDIGSTNRLETQVAQLAAVAGGTNGIFVSNTDNLDIAELTSTASGTVTGVSATGAGAEVDLSAASTIDVNQAISTVGGNVTLSATTGVTSDATNGTITTTAAADSGATSGQVTIDVTGTGDIALAGAIDTSGADHSGDGATASAGGLVDISAADGKVDVDAITTVGGEATHLTAGTGGNAGDIRISTADVTTPAGGTDLTLNSLLIAHAGTGATVGNGSQIELISAGSVSDSNPSVSSTIQGDKLVIQSAGSVDGPFGEVLTDVNEIAIDAVGRVAITEAGHMAITTLTPEGGSPISGITTRGGDVILKSNLGMTSGATDMITTTAAGPATNTETTTAPSGQVVVKVLSAGDVNLQGAIDTRGQNNMNENATAGDGGTVSIVAFDGKTDVGAITTSGGDANDTDGAGGNAGHVLVQSGLAGPLPTTPVDLTLNGTITALGGGGNTAGTGGDVNISALDGNVVDGNGDTANIVAEQLVFDSAGGNIGSDPTTGGSALDTNVRKLAAQVLRDSSGVFISNTGSLHITDVTISHPTADGSGFSASVAGISTQNGEVNISAASMIDVDQPITTNGGNVTLSATTGVTSDATNGTITTTAAADSGATSGQVTIDVTGTGDIALAGAIDTSGADHSGDGATASAGGLVDISAADGKVDVDAITTVGGEATHLTAGTGGDAGGIQISTADVTTPAGGTDITLNGTLNALAGNGMTADGTAAQVELASAGDVLDTFTGGETIAAASLVIAASGSVGATFADRLDTTVDRLAVSAGGANGIAISNSTDLDIVALTGTDTGTVTGLSSTAPGAEVDLFSSGNLDVNQAITTSGGHVTLVAAGDLRSSAANGTITTTGSISTDPLFTDPSGEVSITAGKSVDLLGDIDTSGADNTSATPALAGNGGSVTIVANDGSASVAAIDSSGGRAGNSATDGNSGTGGNAGAIRITTKQGAAATNTDLTLTGMLTALGGTGENNNGSDAQVELASAGSVVDSNTTGNDITAGALVIDAEGDIGASADPLETAVGQLAARADGSNGIFIANTGALDIVQLTGTDTGIITGVSTTAAGAQVDVSAASTIDILQAISTVGGNVTLGATTGITSTAAGAITTTGADPGTSTSTDASGAVTLEVNGTGNVSLAGAIDTSGRDNPNDGGTAGNGGHVTITANDGAVSIAAITTNGGAGADGTAGRSGTGGNAGVIQIFALQGASATNTDITIGGNVSALGGSGDTADGNGSTVLLTAAGSVVDDNTAGSDIAAIALGINAGGNVGSGDSLDTAVSQLTARAGGANGIFISNSGHLDIVFATAAPPFGAVTGVSTTAAGAQVDISAASTIDILRPITTNGGQVTLTATTGITSNATDGTITTTAATDSSATSGTVVIDVTGTGNVNLEGAVDTRGAEHSGNGATASEGGLVHITAQDGSVDVASVTTSGGAATDGTDGTGGNAGIIRILAASLTTPITLNDQLTALGGTGATSAGNGGQVELAAGGSIVDNNPTGSDIWAASLVIAAGGDIGDSAADPLETRVGRLAAQSGGVLGIYIANTGDLDIVQLTGADTGTITGLATTAAGAEVDISAASTIDIERAIITNGGDVNLRATEGITSTAAGTITTTAAANTGIASGGVGAVVTGTGDVNLAGAIDTSGAAHSGGGATASDGGEVLVAALDGSVQVASITTSGGAAASGDGGNAGDIGLIAFDSIPPASSADITLNGALTALGGAGATPADQGDGGGVMFFSDGSVIDANAAGADVAGASLAINAGGDVGGSATDRLETEVGELAATVAGPAGIFVSNTGDLVITTVNTSVTTPNGSHGFTIGVGSVNTSSAGAEVDISVASTLDVQLAMSTQGGGKITLRADDMNIADSVTSSGLVVLEEFTGGTPIYLGAGPGTGDPDGLTLDFAELNRVSADTLRIGSSDAGAITVRDDVSPAGTDTLHLVSGAQINSNGGNQIQEAFLAMEAGTGINVDTVVSTVAAHTNDGGIVIRNNGDLTLGSVNVTDGTVTGVIAEAGTNAGDGTIDIEVASNLFVANEVRADDGSIQLDAFSGGGGIGTISFDPSLTAMTASQDIALNDEIGLDGSMAGQVPPAATIFKTAGNMTFNTTNGDFIMGQNQKLSIPGTLTINAGDNAIFSDLSALIINVNADLAGGGNGAIVVRNRVAANVLLQDGTPRVDASADISGNEINLNMTPTVKGTGAAGPFFYTPDGSFPANVPSSGTFGTGVIFQDFSSLVASDFIGTTGKAAGVVLDITGFPNVQSTNTQPPPLPEEIRIRTGQLGQLNSVSAQSKPLWASEVVAALECSLFEGEDEDLIPPECVDYVAEAGDEPADPRLETEPFQTAQELYKSLFSEFDPMIDALQNASDGYQASQPDPVTGAGFREFIEAEAQYADALDYLKRLGKLDSNLKRLSESIGAQTGDLDDFFELLVDDVTPIGLSPEELHNAIRSGQPIAGTQLFASDNLPVSLRRTTQ